MLPILAFALTGCMGGGFALELGQAPDRSFISGSIGNEQAPPSNDDIIRDTVAGADLGSGLWHDIEWTNPATGDGGVVSYIREDRAVGSVCRAFIASKHSYDGIAQYQGEICRSRMSRDWTLQSMEQQA